MKKLLLKRWVGARPKAVIQSILNMLDAGSYSDMIFTVVRVAQK